LRENIGDKKVIASTMNNIGLIYKDLGNYEKALEYYKKSLIHYRQTGDQFSESNAMNFIGGVYWQSGEYRKALDYYKHSYNLRSQVGDKKYIARAHTNLALVYRSLKEQDSALVEYQNALGIYKEIGDQKNAAASINSIGSLYRTFGQNQMAMQYYNMALDLRKNIGDLNGEAYSSINIGSTYLTQKSYDIALSYFKRAFSIAQQLKNINLEKDALKYLARVYSALGDYKEAYKNFTAYSRIKDEILSGESIKRIADMQIRYETEKKGRELQEKSNEVIQQKEKNRRQLILIYFGVVLLIIISVSTLFIIRQNRRVKKTNVLLAIKNQEILQQKEEISAQRDAIEEQKNEIEKQRDIAEKQRDQIASQNNKITDSIEYASRIQSAVLPPESVIKEIVPSYFIMYRPRDIVSGDFYFVRKAKNKTVVAAVDSTGHGVPGAFMSMLGTSLLTEIVSNEQFENAADILEKLRENVKSALHQTGGDDDKTSDGMDCALCVIDYENNVLDFAGANNPLVIIRNEELIEHNGDRMPIGVHLIKEEPFTNNRIALQSNDMLYMYSDGYYDQFGGEKGRKLFMRNFKGYLMDVHKFPVQEQKQKLEQFFDAWKGKQRQIDDVIVVGLKI